MTPNEAGTVSLDEAVSMLHLSRAEVYRRVRDKVLEGEKVDRRLRFNRGEIERYAEVLEKDRRQLEEAVEKWLLFFAGRLERRTDAVIERVADKPMGERVAEMGERMLQDALHAGARDVYLDPLYAGMRLLYNAGRIEETARFEACMSEPLNAWLKGLAEPGVAGAGGNRGSMLTRTSGETTYQLGITEVPTLLGAHYHIHLFTDFEGTCLEDLGYTSDQAKRLTRDLVSRPGLILFAGSGTPEDDRHRISLARTLADSGQLVVCLDHKPGFRDEQLVQLDLQDGEESCFESVWRAALRMTPDVVVLDDVRHAAGARALLEGVLSGAAVLAQVRARDMIAAIQRLMEFEIDGAALSRALVGGVEKAVVRRLCAGCSQRRPLSAEEAARTGTEAGTEVGRAVGCKACGDGFSGRRHVYGLWPAGPELAGWISGAHACPPGAPAGPQSLTGSLRRVALNGEVAFEDACAFFPPAL